MNKEKTLLVFKNIKASSHGQEFIDYLKSAAAANYKSFKNCNSEMNDIHKGYAICVDSLLELFRECEKERPNVEVPDWN